METLKYTDAETAGDINDDTMLNERDYELFVDSLLGMVDAEVEAADVNMNGKMGVDDLVSMKKKEIEDVTEDSGNMETDFKS